MGKLKHSLWIILGLILEYRPDRSDDNGDSIVGHGEDQDAPLQPNLQTSRNPTPGPGPIVGNDMSNDSECANEDYDEPTHAPSSPRGSFTEERTPEFLGGDHQDDVREGEGDSPDNAAANASTQREYHPFLNGTCLNSIDVYFLTS